jgi:hypothetical protein
MGWWPLLAYADSNPVGSQGQNTKPPAHQILVMRPHQVGPDDRGVDQAPDFYRLRISGHLGPTPLSAFPSMVAQLEGGDTLLTGLLDRSALYGVLAEIEVLGLDLVELRRLLPPAVSRNGK